jgi:hypothetical protein
MISGTMTTAVSLSMLALPGDLIRLPMPWVHGRGSARSVGR